MVSQTLSHLLCQLMKERLIESFSDHVPGITEIGRFSIGFFESRNSSGKQWIISPEDLKMMYKKFHPRSKIPLWCDEKSDSKKRSSDESQEAAAPLSKREKKETNIDTISLEFQDKHGSKFSGPQYKLWARSTENGQ